MEQSDMGSDSGMGSMNMGNGIPGLFYMQKMYWVIVGSAITFACVVNLLNKLLAWQRSRSGNAKPKSIFWTSYATATAITREISYASTANLGLKTLPFTAPTLGQLVLVISNLTVVLILCFYRLNTLDQWSWENIGYRTGFIGLSQLPLIFLLASKENLIGFFTGISYERLNWLHRWTARTLWLTATIHMGFWFRSWNRYDRIGVNLTTDQLTQRGFAAWCILTFIVATSFAPARQWNYELFVAAHVVTFSGFIGAIWLHVPQEVKVYVWIPIGLFFFDRLLRACRILYLNLGIFESLRRKLSTNRRILPLGTSNCFWAFSATLTPLPGNVTRICIPASTLFWQPGQHMRLFCHSLLPLQSHPFTIASLPADGSIDFLIKSRGGATKLFFNHASTAHHQLSYIEINKQQVPQVKVEYTMIEGPYGRIRPLTQFDSVVFIAGSTGASFTVPHMRHIVQTWVQNRDRPSSTFKCVTRRIRFVWAVKAREHVAWFGEQLSQVVDDAKLYSEKEGGSEVGVEVEISVYVTCDEELKAENPRKITTTFERLSHGVTKEVSDNKGSLERLEKKQKSADEALEVKTLSPSSPSTSSPPPPSAPNNTHSCGPNGSCCCRTTLTDEKTSALVCNCSQTAEPSATMTTTPPPPSSSRPTFNTPSLHPPLHPLSLSGISFLTGRPHPVSIIRRTLEHAEGESAVVVCGPKGLRDDVRSSVVLLGDERAVHKGTGAQGVYLHVEGFEY